MLSTYEVKLLLSSNVLRLREVAVKLDAFSPEEAERTARNAMWHLDGQIVDREVREV